MGIFDKIMFWKKDPFADLDKDLDSLKAPTKPHPTGTEDRNVGLGGRELGLGAHEPGLDTDTTMDFVHDKGFTPQSLGDQGGTPVAQQPTYAEQPRTFAQEPPQHYSLQKDFEIISSKLDALKAALDSLNQRVINIERIAMGEQRQQQQKRYQW